VEVNTRFKCGDLVFTTGYDHLGNKRKNYATVVSWKDFVTFYNQIYGTEYGRLNAEKLIGNHAPGTLTLVKWHFDGQITHTLSSNLRCTKARLPEFLW